VSRSLGDLFAELGAELLATPEDKAEFRDAARDLLAADPELKRQLKPLTRAQLLNGPIDTPAWQAALLAQVQRALPHETKDGELPALFAQIRRALPPKAATATAAIVGLRILTAYLITRGFARSVPSNIVLKAALFLRKSQRQIETLQRQISGGSRTKRHVGSDPAVEWARHAWADWRGRNSTKPKTQGAQVLYRQARKRYPTRWRNAESFRVWLHRNGVAI
jgi:hypothetical protein